MDFVFGLPYARLPHPAYKGERIPAYEMIRFSVNIMRGCFGGCTFCSITEHEGRIIQTVRRNPSSANSKKSAITPRLYRRDFRPRWPHREYVPAGVQRPKIEASCRKPAVCLPRHLPKPQHRPRRALKELVFAPPSIYRALKRS